MQELVNFGFIQWNKESAYVNADTSFKFEGEDISYLFLTSDSIHKSISFDSSFFQTHKEKKAYLTPVPSLLSLSYQFILSPTKADIEVGVNYLFFADALPEESLLFSYNISHIQQIGLKVRYGGYTGFQTGLAYKIFFLKRWMFTIQSDYLSSLINPDVGNAQGAFISLSAYF